MTLLEIDGGRPLMGAIEASGSKNAALPIMAASILADGPVRLQGVPRLADVDTLGQVLQQLGVSVAGSERDLCLSTVDTAAVRADYELVRRMRASFCVLGPLVARRGRAVVSLPGGCAIGHRPVDLHLKGLAALGASLRLRHGYVIAHAARLAGATIDMRGPHGPTVTGTANVLSAAVLAKGTTNIHGAAVEPEIVDLANFLNAMGARISGQGTTTLRIEGVERLSATSHRVIPDRIEIATLLLAAAITRGQATVVGVVPEHLDRVAAALRRTGAEVDFASDQVTIAAARPPRSLSITARPYPGIPTDVQAQWMALLALAPGRSVVRDCVFPDRFLHVAELNRLGAQIQLCRGEGVVAGVGFLTGARVRASDLRASAALVLAGLAARGRTTIEDADHLDRGYERLDEKLGRLGACIRRYTESKSTTGFTTEGTEGHRGVAG